MYSSRGIDLFQVYFFLFPLTSDRGAAQISLHLLYRIRLGPKVYLKFLLGILNISKHLGTDVIAAEYIRVKLTLSSECSINQNLS